MGTLWINRHRIMRKTISLVCAFVFISNFVFHDAWAVVVEPRAMPFAQKEEKISQLDVDTFVLPPDLGIVRYSWKAPKMGTVPDVSDEARRAKVEGGLSPFLGATIIHIQDAHCNYAAQKKISEIIEYLNKEYGIISVNLEGGRGGYDLSDFTDIYDKTMRNDIADYFLRWGRVNGAELFALNNPDKVDLWGVEDTALYIKNLNVYRDSLGYKEEVNKYLGQLDYIMGNLKRHIFSQELLELDKKFAEYKEEKIEFKDYLLYLIEKAKQKGINIREFPNMYLLNQSFEEENKINFKKANDERDVLVDELERILSKNELTELVSKTVQFKNKAISQSDFYEYLIKKAKGIGKSLESFPELQKYIIYISLYNAVDKTAVMDEMEKLESSIKDTLFQNEKQRELELLSKNLILTKNIFDISFTKQDYMYYKKNESAFDVNNYITFINKEAPLYKISISLDKNIARLDEYRARIFKFFEYSFQRDDVFLKNLKFQRTAYSVQRTEKQATILIAGGFHTENLCDLFKKNNISYISIMPTFKNEEGQENPYFNILSGGMSPLEKEIDSAMSSMQVYDFLSELGVEVEGPKSRDIFRMALEAMKVMRYAAKTGVRVPRAFRVGEKKYIVLAIDNNNAIKIGVVQAKAKLPGRTMVVKNAQGEEEIFSPRNIPALIDGFHQIVDEHLKDAKRDYLNEENSEMIRNLLANPDLPEVLKVALQNLVRREKSGVQLVDGLFTGHTGQAIYLPAGEGLTLEEQKGLSNVLIYELVVGMYKGKKIPGKDELSSRALATAVVAAFRDKKYDVMSSLLDGAEQYAKPLWEMLPEERRAQRATREFMRVAVGPTLEDVLSPATETRGGWGGWADNIRITVVAQRFNELMDKEERGLAPLTRLGFTKAQIKDLARMARVSPAALVSQIQETMAYLERAGFTFRGERRKNVAQSIYILLYMPNRYKGYVNTPRNERTVRIVELGDFGFKEADAGVIGRYLKNLGISSDELAGRILKILIDTKQHGITIPALGRKAAINICVTLARGDKGEVFRDIAAWQMEPILDQSLEIEKQASSPTQGTIEWLRRFIVQFDKLPLLMQFATIDLILGTILDMAEEIQRQDPSFFSNLSENTLKFMFGRLKDPADLSRLFTKLNTSAIIGMLNRIKSPAIKMLFLQVLSPQQRKALQEIRGESDENRAMVEEAILKGMVDGSGKLKTSVMQVLQARHKMAQAAGEATEEDWARLSKDPESLVVSINIGMAEGAYDAFLLNYLSRLIKRDIPRKLRRSYATASSYDVFFEEIEKSELFNQPLTNPETGEFTRILRRLYIGELAHRSGVTVDETIIEKISKALDDNKREIDDLASLLGLDNSSARDVYIEAVLKIKDIDIVNVLVNELKASLPFQWQQLTPAKFISIVQAMDLSLVTEKVDREGKRISRTKAIDIFVSPSDRKGQIAFIAPMLISTPTVLTELNEEEINLNKDAIRVTMMSIARDENTPNAKKWWDRIGEEKRPDQTESYQRLFQELFEKSKELIKIARGTGKTEEAEALAVSEGTESPISDTERRFAEKKGKKAPVERLLVSVKKRGQEPPFAGATIPLFRSIFELGGDRLAKWYDRWAFTIEQLTFAGIPLLFFSQSVLGLIVAELLLFTPLHALRRLTSEDAKNWRIVIDWRQLTAPLIVSGLVIASSGLIGVVPGLTSFTAGLTTLGAAIGIHGIMNNVIVPFLNNQYKRAFNKLLARCNVEVEGYVFQALTVEVEDIEKADLVKGVLGETDKVYKTLISGIGLDRESASDLIGRVISNAIITLKGKPSRLILSDIKKVLSDFNGFLLPAITRIESLSHKDKNMTPYTREEMIKAKYNIIEMVLGKRGEKQPGKRIPSIKEAGRLINMLLTNTSNNNAIDLLKMLQKNDVLLQVLNKDHVDSLEKVRDPSGTLRGLVGNFIRGETPADREQSRGIPSIVGCLQGGEINKPDSYDIFLNRVERFVDIYLKQAGSDIGISRALGSIGEDGVYRPVNGIFIPRTDNFRLVSRPSKVGGITVYVMEANVMTEEEMKRKSGPREIRDVTHDIIEEIPPFQTKGFPTGRKFLPFIFSDSGVTGTKGPDSLLCRLDDDKVVVIFKSSSSALDRDAKDAEKERRKSILMMYMEKISEMRGEEIKRAEMRSRMASVATEEIGATGIPRQVGEAPLSPIERKVAARVEGRALPPEEAMPGRPYSSMKSMLEGTPDPEGVPSLKDAILARLKMSLSKEEGTAAEVIIDQIGDIYKKMGLTAKNYHNQAHNLGVTFGMLLLSKGEDPRDISIAFLAALLHDFHIRSAETKDATGNIRGTSAFVQETMAQLDWLFSRKEVYKFPYSEGAPRMPEELLVGLRTSINEFLIETGHDPEIALKQIKAMIRRTDFASNVAPGELIYKYMANAARKRAVDDKFRDKEEITDDEIGRAREDLTREYEKIRRKIHVDKSKQSPEKRKAWHKQQIMWLSRQQGIEMAYLDALKGVEDPKQRGKIHDLAFRLEKGADQSGFYVLVQYDHLQEEVVEGRPDEVKGLKKEIPTVGMAGTSHFFMSPELIYRLEGEKLVVNEEILKVLRHYPPAFRKNFYEGLKLFIRASTIPGNEVIPAAQRLWQRDREKIAEALGLEIGPKKMVGRVAVPVAERLGNMGKGILVDGVVPPARELRTIEEAGFLIVRHEPSGQEVKVKLSEKSSGVNKTQLIKSLEDLLYEVDKKIRRKNALTDEEYAAIEGLRDRLNAAKFDEVVLIEHDDRLLGHFGSNGKLYIDEQLLNSQALLHEMIHGYLSVPRGAEGIDKHTVARGVGEDARIAFQLIYGDFNTIRDNAEALVEKEGGIGKFIDKLAEQVKVVRGRVMTEHEKNWIRYKYNTLSQRNDINNIGMRILFSGIQEDFDPAGYAALSQDLVKIKDDMSRYCDNLIFDENYDVVKKNALEQWGRKAGRKLTKDWGVKNSYSTFGISDEFTVQSLLDRIKEEVGRSIEEGKSPMAIIKCVDKNTLDEVKRLLSLPEYAHLEKIVRIIDKTGLGREYTDDVLRLVIYANQALNDERMGVYFNVPPDAETRVDYRNKMTARLVRARYFTEDQIKDAVGREDIRLGSMTAEDLETFLSKVYKGEIPIDITPVNWQEVPDYNDAMEAVYKSL